MYVNNPAAEIPWKLEGITGGIPNKNWPNICNTKNENLAYLMKIPRLFNMIPWRSVDFSDFIHELHIQ
jgi:hypothetical protein